eukprot:CAMPEP_0202718786 /NCGR_PEP_ID=MMETSP1385-20130828/125388_1 /ASSEMBLY_ACC=CAM_ASM_000861 /TAXON_ID=933848 /ORGANISM="Elphidium margaritaceum" /LENGTH=83 /DNA_ID=CAMNT_0049381661 /DNA_START=56 /DNA_END=304 /DNA_ORIENTATION=+
MENTRDVTFTRQQAHGFTWRKLPNKLQNAIQTHASLTFKVSMDLAGVIDMNDNDITKAHLNMNQERAVDNLKASVDSLLKQQQ